ncbi:hypothetical protein [Gordonia sp. i37]|uniref:hypothetical protein n=1 Tax=Gordonia sp. i37 TaxID=1961707 RepID=UPI00155551CC|nr:hypothetical protein [Gordonia sp. i37]
MLPTSPRALRDPELRRRRVDEAKTVESVLELNRLVWRISRRERCEDRLPYLDPTYGGVNADVIVLLKAPQADADPRRGEGRLISLDNDDDVAAVLFDLFAELGIDRSRCVGWNICPYPTVGFDPNSDELSRGRGDFDAFLRLLTRPKAILVLGSAVRRGWLDHSFDELLGSEMRVVFGPSPYGIDRRRGARASLRESLLDAFERNADR